MFTRLSEYRTNSEIILKLSKMMYYAEGCSLASGNGSLFDEPILAWEHGPVIRSVWNKYHGNPYMIPYTDEDSKLADTISDNDKEIG